VKAAPIANDYGSKDCVNLSPSIAVSSLNSLFSSLQHLFYPAFCIHCKSALHQNQKLLCTPCFDLLELLETDERCPYCFSTDYHKRNQVCGRCLKQPRLFDGMAAAFEYTGPAASLIKHLKYAKQPYLAKGCAPFLCAQFLQLNWPLPDYIVPVPMSRTHLFMRGFNQSLLIAQELSRLIEKPTLDVLKRRSGDFSQAGLSRKQRKELHQNAIHLKKESHLLLDKTLLLVDDVMTTGSTLRRCSEALGNSFPKAIYAITVCH